MLNELSSISTSSTRLDTRLKKYEDIVNKKNIELRSHNNQIKNERRTLDFQFKPGTEITQNVRENLPMILKEFQRYSEMEIPFKQRQTLKNIVNSHRIFIASDVDHDRARIEFDTMKTDIVKKYENNYNVEWPKYNSNIYCNDKLFAKKGKGVSRHHSIPVRAILVEEGSELEMLIDTKKVDPSKALNLEHYKINEFWNMIPLKDPKNHIDGIHGDDTLYSKVFGKILLDYHYKQVDPLDETHFESIVKENHQIKKLPEFSSNIEFHLKTLDKKLSLPIHDKQREHLLNHVSRFVKHYPDNNQIKKASYEQILDNLSCFYRNKTRIKELKTEWEFETKQTWPKDAKVEFLLPVYYNYNTIQWWMIQPGHKEIEYKKRKPISKPKNNLTIEEGFEIQNKRAKRIKRAV